LEPSKLKNIKYKRYSFVDIRRLIYLFTAIGFPPGGSVSVNWYRNRKEASIYKRRNNTQNNTEAKNVQN